MQHIRYAAGVIIESCLSASRMAAAADAILAPAMVLLISSTQATRLHHARPVLTTASGRLAVSLRQYERSPRRGSRFLPPNTHSAPGRVVFTPVWAIAGSSATAL